MALIDKLNAIGDAIREKNGTSDLIPLADMPQAILDISGGGEISLVDMVYSHYGVSKEEHPCCAISFNTFQKKVFVYFATTVTCASASSNLQLNAPYLTGSASYSSYSDFDNVEGVVQFALDNIQSLTEKASGYANITPSNTKSYINFDKGVFSGTVYEIPSGSSNGTEEIENLIDNSGVLDSTEGSVSEKVEQLIEKANKVDLLQYVKTARGLFHSARNFPSKATVVLPYVTDVYQAFANWNKEPIPVVEELTVNAPSTSVSNNQACMGQMFTLNNGVKKVILNMPNESQYMISTFSQCGILEEVVLDFSTKNITNYESTFSNSKKLKKITGVLDFSSATNIAWMFANCNNLENVTFAPNTLSLSISLANSSLLTTDSVDSIIGGLKTLEEGATAQTLTLHKNIVLTDEQKATINAKGWTLAQ